MLRCGDFERRRAGTPRARPATPIRPPRSRCLLAAAASVSHAAFAGACSAFKTNDLRCSCCLAVDLVVVVKEIAAATPILQRFADISDDSREMS